MSARTKRSSAVPEAYKSTVELVRITSHYALEP